MTAALVLTMSVAAAASLVAQDDPRALAAQLAAPDPVTRARAACELRKLDGGAVVALDGLVELLRDGSPVEASVCNRHWGYRDGLVTSPGQLAASTLVAIGSRSFAPLLRSLESPAWFARRNAAWALGALDDPRAIPALTTSLSDSEPQVREQAAWALGALNGETAVPALISAVRDTDARVRAQAAWALGAIGDSRALAAVLAALRDADPLVRRQGAWAAGILAR